ncbi:MAG: hypothetical protein U1E81_06205 [Xanthobacteraceae bacterium]
MAEFPPVLRARLITAFGTVLYIDSAGELRHGPIESSPENAFLLQVEVSEGSLRRVSLACGTDSSREGIVCMADHSQSISRFDDRNAITPNIFELIPLERGLVALRSNGLFLSAIPDGRITLLAPVCSTWELFLASENWCSDPLETGEGRTALYKQPQFDRKRIARYIIHPLIRMRANTKPKARKILIYGYPQWSHGRVYYDLCKQLHDRGYIVDILNWRENHADYFFELSRYYDLFMSALDGVAPLVDTYRVAPDRIIALSHHEYDIRMLVEQKGSEIFDKFANYGVVSEFLYCASVTRGIRRAPGITSLGIDYSEFYADLPTRLTSVGYASSLSVTTYGVEWKRGCLAEAAAHKAGLQFKLAGSTAWQMSFHDMPDFYKSVGAVLTSSISEAAQLPVMEAAAAGRLVIGTAVGHFPLKAYQGGGIIAPIEPERFISFTSATLQYYRDNPSAYSDKCRLIQEAAEQFDWRNSIEDWVDLAELRACSPSNLYSRHFERAALKSAPQHSQRRSGFSLSPEIKDSNILEAFPLFVPYSAGNDEDRRALTIKAINQSFPCLSAIAKSVANSKIATLAVDEFPKTADDYAAANELKAYFDKWGSDKSTAHNYHLIYGPILKERYKIKGLLEIGIGSIDRNIVSNMGLGGRPGASLRAFRDFLDQAKIYGADIDRAILFEEDRIETFYVDQTNEESFDDLRSRLPDELDIVIDDGLHSPNANLQTLKFGLSKVRIGGWVIVEDIALAAVPLWETVAVLLPSHYRSAIFQAKGGVVFAVQRLHHALT